MLLLTGCGPGDYVPYRTYSYDPYYRPYWEYHYYRDRDRHRGHRHAPPPPSHTLKPAVPAPSSPVGRRLGDAFRRGH